MRGLCQALLEEDMYLIIATCSDVCTPGDGGTLAGCPSQGWLDCAVQWPLLVRSITPGHSVILLTEGLCIYDNWQLSVIRILQCCITPWQCRRLVHAMHCMPVIHAV